jgi:hypothetical protein
MTERRGSILRRDLNDLVRDESGHLSPTKIGTLVGQWLSVKLILENGHEIIANWDSLTVLFSVLIAPELFKKLMNMKYGGTTTITTDTSSQTSTQKVTR